MSDESPLKQNQRHMADALESFRRESLERKTTKHLGSSRARVLSILQSREEEAVSFLLAAFYRLVQNTFSTFRGVRVMAPT